jgi:hypothetical protein
MRCAKVFPKPQYLEYTVFFQFKARLLIFGISFLAWMWLKIIHARSSKMDYFYPVCLTKNRKFSCESQNHKQEKRFLRTSDAIRRLAPVLQRQ